MGADETGVNQGNVTSGGDSSRAHGGVWPPDHAGWFNDPWRQAPLRYFNGADWSGRVLGAQQPPSNSSSFLNTFSSHRVTPQVGEHEIVSHAGKFKPNATTPGKKTFFSPYEFLKFVPLVFIVFGFIVFSETVKEGEATRSGVSVVFWCLLAVCFLAGWLSFTSWKKYVTIKDTPTVDVVGAHLGPCEFSGFTKSYFVPTKSLLSERKCVWTRTYVERFVKGRQNGGHWETVVGVEDGVPVFYLEDLSGAKILVDLRGTQSRGWVFKTVHHERKSQVRLVEECLELDQEMFVFGFVQLTDEGQLVVKAKGLPGDKRTRSVHFVAHPGTEEDVLNSKKTALLFLNLQLFLGLFAASFAFGFSVIGYSWWALPASLAFMVISSFPIGKLGGRWWPVNQGLFSSSPFCGAILVVEWLRKPSAARMLDN